MWENLYDRTNNVNILTKDISISLKDPVHSYWQRILLGKLLLQIFDKLIKNRQPSYTRDDITRQAINLHIGSVIATLFPIIQIIIRLPDTSSHTIPGWMIQYVLPRMGRFKSLLIPHNDWLSYDLLSILCDFFIFTLEHIFFFHKYCTYNKPIHKI